MVREKMVDDLLPTIICGDFRLQRHMWRNENVGDILRRLEMGSFYLRVHYSIPNPIKEHNLEQLVQLLRVRVTMDRKYRPLMASIPISPTSVISAIVSSTEKTHPIATVCQ
jgi:hypothetical protein